MVEYVYDSWGKKLSTTGTLATTLGKYQPFRYRGYVYDEETQWYYLQSRYYDPNTRRFISADVYLSTGQGVIGHNSFAYCNNEPVLLSDDAGHMPLNSTWNYACTDSGSFNSYYSSTGLCRTKREKELLDMLVAEGAMVYRSNSHPVHIDVKESKYQYTRSEKNKKIPGIFIGTIVDSVMSGIVTGFAAAEICPNPYVDICAAGLGTIANVVKDVTAFNNQPDSPFDVGITYDALIVTIQGYEYNCLTGALMPYTDIFCYATSANSIGEWNWYLYESHSYEYFGGH